MCEVDIVFSVTILCWRKLRDCVDKISVNADDTKSPKVNKKLLLRLILLNSTVEKPIQNIMPRKKRCASPPIFDDFEEDFEDEVSSNGI